MILRSMDLMRRHANAIKEPRVERREKGGEEELPPTSLKLYSGDMLAFLSRKVRCCTYLPLRYILRERNTMMVTEVTVVGSLPAGITSSARRSNWGSL